ncbi:golgin candidate 3-like [Schistocerca americana]|uniref:golgin candidate 3-like n=1 Tax=Schistocerca americana TaxID=7009 RepID=UPI001F50372A|nr:golgin candidate 3-like [Schistocerca americana]
MSTEDKQVCEAVVEWKEIGQEDREDSGISDYGVSLDSPLAHSTSYPKTPGQTMRNKSVSEDADKWSMLVDLIKENNASLEKGLRESLEKGLQETNASLEKGLQETRESLKGLQETRESLETSFKETLTQELKTLERKIECNLKKEMQELQERLKMDIDERERKLQKSIDQVQGDVEKMEGKLTKKMEDDIEETKAKLGERINEVETNCNHRIAKVTQMQKQCNDAVKGIGDRQNQLAVNLRNAIAVQREEDNKRVAMEERQLQQGVQKLESKTEEIDKRISNATLTVGEGRVVTLMNSDNRYIQNNTGQKFRPKGGLHPMIFMKWLKGVFPAHLKDSDKIQFAIDRM